MMEQIYGVLITVLFYSISQKIYQKFKIALLNPILMSIAMVIIVLLVQKVPYEYYNVGGSYITYLLGPIVVLLAVPLYKNWSKIREHFIPIITGIGAGIITSIVSVYGLSKLFGLEALYSKSLFAKSITTPLAVEVTKMADGIEGLTIVAVIITGIIGATIAPVVMKVGRVEDEIAKGIGIGTSSHGIGTSKAVEMGTETAGASGLAMGITGIVTVLLGSILF